MPDQRFERVVDAYLENSVSPGDLAWLRSRINLDDGLREAFLKKCRQHQSTQYFMVQKTLEPNWGGVSVEELKDDGSSNVEQNDPENPPADGRKNGPSAHSGGRSWRAVLDYSILSGLICLSIVLGVAWLDRGRIYHQEPNPNPGVNVHQGLSTTETYADDAFHTHLQTPSGGSNDKEPSDTIEASYLSVQQLQWFFQQGDCLMEGRWGDVPTDYGIDFQKLDLLFNQSQFQVSEFPHSMLNPTPLLQGKLASP